MNAARAAAVDALPATVRALVRLSARVTAGTDRDVRDACHEVLEAKVPAVWVEEAILQAYLLAGFPRTLNAMREWRKASGSAATPAPTISGDDIERWRVAGEQTCATVYGPFYDKLRHNIAELHPALDDWMIVEGYGKILSRPGLELRLRELCVVAACVATNQDRQLHSHLHGSLNAGASADEVRATVAALEGIVGAEARKHALQLFEHVLGKK